MTPTPPPCPDYGYPTPPRAVRLSAPMAGTYARNAAVAEHAIANYSGRSQDYERQQADRFAASAGIDSRAHVITWAWLALETNGSYRLLVGDLFDHKVTQHDAENLLRHSPPPPAPVVAFIVGQSYATRSVCDSECIYSFTIHARTAKSVTVDVHGKRVRRGLYIAGGAERFNPFGTYSMAPSIAADRPQA